jgi:hypothetical protein
LGGVPIVNTPLLPNGTALPEENEWIVPENPDCFVQPTSPITTTTEATVSVNPVSILLTTTQSTTLLGDFLADGWRIPQNLSRSGVAHAPTMVRDVTGIHHVLWRDVANAFTYLTGANGQWGAPQIVELPFGTRRYSSNLSTVSATPLYQPKLFADGEGNIHALWRAEDDALFYSKVPASEFSNFSAWSSRQQLAEQALDMTMVVDESGVFHLVYVRSQESNDANAGIYYRRSFDGGNNWNNATPVTLSRYFIGQATEDIQLDLAVSGRQLFLVWDNLRLGRVFFARSLNGGSTWIDPFTIDQRLGTDRIELAVPQHIDIATAENTLHVVWQAGHETDVCAVYHRFSVDNGVNWTEPQAVLPNLAECPDSFALVGGTDTFPLLQVSLPTASYLLAWNGTKWSDPQLQPTLSAFDNADTGQAVTLGCLNIDRTGQNTLIVLGCSGNGTQDVWVTERLVADLEGWFPAPPIWSLPEVIVTTDSTIVAPRLVEDVTGGLHLFFKQADDRGLNAGIYYARWDGTRWSRPNPVLATGSRAAGEIAVVASATGQLYATWHGGGGVINFSRVESSRAGIADDWSVPVAMPALHPSASDSTMAVDNKGIIYVAYALAVNENRGIYLTTSVDGGETWTEAQLVFDGVAANWARVDTPSLAVSPEGTLHLFWRRYGLSAVPESLGLYYAHSQNNGISWTEPKIVTEQPVLWEAIVAIDERLVHRLWQDQQNGRVTLWHEWSQDGGQVWERARSMSNAESMPMLTKDRSQRLQLAVIDAETIQQWVWQEERWEAAQAEPLPSVAVGAGAMVAQNSNLAVVFASTTEDGDVLLFTHRQLELSNSVATPLPTLTPTPIPTETPIAFPTVQPTPTPVFPLTQDGTGLPFNLLGSGSNSMVENVGIAGILAGLIVLGVFGAAVWSGRRQR